jgi:uncharacterized Zn finger protein (UPF0148 family)
MTNPFEKAMRNAAQGRGLMPKAETDEVEATCPNCGTTFEVEVDNKADDAEERDPSWQTDSESAETGSADPDAGDDDFQANPAKFRALVAEKRRAEALANPDSDLAKAAAALEKGFAAVFGPRKRARNINEL